jgi:tetratricopeptide (TPR) repeat protein
MKGVLAVETFFNNVLGWIYRRQVEHDFGVDGEVELTDAMGAATGILLKVQVKSGPSYFEKGDGKNIWFYPSPEKMAYWDGHSLPLILALHDPDADRTYWTRATKASAHQTPKGWRINVPRDQFFAKSSKAVLEAIARERAGRTDALPVLMATDEAPTPYLADALRAAPKEPETEQIVIKGLESAQSEMREERPGDGVDALAIDAALETMSWKQVLSLAAAQLRLNAGEAKAGPRQGEDPKLHARIDSLREINRAGSPRVAYDKFQALLKTIDRAKTPHAVFRAQSNMAAAALDLGLTNEAVAAWEVAHEVEPGNLHGVATLALARLVQGNTAEARKLAQQALEGPEPEKAAASVLYQALANDVTWTGDPDTLIPASIHDSAEVNLGRVEYMRRRRDPAWRQAAIDAAARHPDEDVFRYTAAHAVLDQASPFNDPTQPLDRRVDRADLAAASKTLEARAEAWLRDDYKDLHELEAYANNAAVGYRLLGDYEAAKRLVDRVLAAHPGLLGLRKLQGVIEAIHGDKAKAIEILALVTQDGEAQLYRAELMSDSEPKAALEMLLAVDDAIVPPEHKITRWLIAASIALRLGDRKTLDQAIGEIAKDPARALLADVFAIERDGREGLDEGAVRERLLEVVSRLDAQTSLGTRASLADLLSRRQLWYEASECLEGYVNLAQADENTILYVQTLAAARRDKRLLAVLGEASQEVLDDPAVIRTLALHAFNTGDLGKAEGYARRLVKAHPDDLDPVLVLLEVLARRDERRAIARVLARDLEGLKAERTGERIKLARYLFAFGERERALRYVYWLSWRYRDDRRAVMAQCFQTLEATREAAGPYGPKIVGENVVVDIKADGEAIQFVVEPDAELRRLNDRAWEPTHKLVAATLGKAVGDEVQLADGEVGKIKAIRHKYVARMQETLQSLHRRFPDNPGFQKFKVEPKKAGGLDKVYAQAKANADAVETALNDYKAGHALISMLALQLGGSALDATEGMAFGGPRLINALGAIQERNAAAAALGLSLGKGFVIDSATFWCLWRLKAADTIVQTFGQMHVASIIFDELASRREYLEPHAVDGLKQLGYRNGRPTFTETSAEAIRNGISQVDEAVAWLKANAKVCPAHTPETLPEDIARSLGQMRFHFLDEVFIALNENLLLLSDDQRLRAMALELGVLRSAWTQWALGVAAEQKIATVDQYVTWSAQLVAMGHAYIGVTPQVLLRGLKLDVDEGVVRTPSGRFVWLTRALGGRAAEPVSHMRVVGAVINAVWRHKALYDVREFATGRLLERLVVEREDSPMLINALGELFDSRRDILNYMRGWLRWHFLLTPPSRKKSRRKSGPASGRGGK